MSWLFRRRIRVIPGVRLNLSKSGLTASVGVRGGSVTLGGKGGTYANVGIPGTGIYSRRRIGKKNSSSFEEENSFNGETFEESVSTPDEEFVSADPLDITSEGLQAIQEAVLAANRQRQQLKGDLSEIKNSIISTRLLKLLSQITLLYYIFPAIKRTVNKNLASMLQASKEVTQGIQESFVDLELDMKEEAKNAYEELIPAFQELGKSNFIWDVTSSTDVDMVRTRSAIPTTVERVQTSLRQTEIPGIKSIYKALCFTNMNGADIYLYPGFVVMYKSPENFGIVEMSQLELNYKDTEFVETEVTPKDAEHIRSVWEKSNKDGSRDKRYSENKQLPVMGYGEITLSSETGIYEKYMFSNASSAKSFILKINNFKDLI